MSDSVMEVVEDQEDQFEDYTTASHWESFTAALEHTLMEWQSKPVMDSGSIRNGWIVLSDSVVFADFPFSFTYFRKIEDTGQQAPTKDVSPAYCSGCPPYIETTSKQGGSLFPPAFAPHIVAHYFDLKEFAVLSVSGKEPLTSESRLKVLKSSACIALNSTNSCFPILIQFHHWNDNFFDGVGECGGTRTNFSMVRLKNVPIQHKFLGGLLNIFKSKMNPTLNAPVGVTVHFFYKMQSWPHKYTFDSFPVELFEELLISLTDAEMDKRTGTVPNPACTSILPFGSPDDPFMELELVAGWPFVTEDVVVDTPTYSDLDPMNAPEWHFSMKAHKQAEFKLREVLESFWKLENDVRSIEETLGKNLDDDANDIQYVSALERLALANSGLPTQLNAVISNVNVVQRQLLYSTSPNQYTDLPPVSNEHTRLLLQYLFPDSSDSAIFAYPPTFEYKPSFKSESCISYVESLQSCKSAPVGSLTWRLAVIMSYLNSFSGGASSVAHFWAELILELRFRLEQAKELPGLEKGAPNSGTCLLNQKLQMLNCCIAKKIQREQVGDKSDTDGQEGKRQSGEESVTEDEDDEFFDCDDEEETPEGDKSDQVVDSRKPQGRLQKCGRLRLLKTGEPMYIPVTQDPAPLTEDVVEEQAKQLVELGDDAGGSEQRAKMMSASLQSDMESFKAANPGAQLEDFVRWYSPRDWIESEETDEFGSKKGELSPRMQVPGNLWLEVWSSAQTIPARRQRRLFDDTREAGKILHWMRTRKLRDISQLLYPVLAHVTVLKVLEEVDKVDLNYSVPPQLVQHTVQLTRAIRPRTPFEATNGEDVQTGAESNGYNYFLFTLGAVVKSERDLTQIRSFQQKFPQMDIKTVLRSSVQTDSAEKTSDNELLQEYIKVDGGPKSDLAEVIKDIFRLSKDDGTVENESAEFKFGDPAKKVFVLKYCPSKSVCSSQYNQEETLPQRMSCLIKNDEFLLAGTFTTRTDVS